MKPLGPSTRLLKLYLILTTIYLRISSGHHVSNVSADEEDAAARVTAENKDHIDQAIETLMNPDTLNIDHHEAGRLHRVDSGHAERLTYSSTGDDYSLENEADVQLMNVTFSNIFSQPRSDAFSKRLKETARQAIVTKFKEYKLETFTQSFTASKRGKNVRGTNLIGILPGRFRDVHAQDKILLLGAHYDTVESSPGIDDNGSGMVATLEVARILHAKPQLNHTVMFVAFDLEELGLLGSTAFVREYLIPKELIAKQSKFLGAYVIDMVLNYDSSPGSQILPRDILSGTPDISRKISSEGNRGDFVAVWSRKNVDDPIFAALASEWRRSRDGQLYKIRAFEPQLPSTSPSSSDLHRFGTYTRSDHASFWYHKHPGFKQTLNAVLLTDMGPWRGLHKKCYHAWCDDANQLTTKNLNFLKHTVDILARVIEKANVQSTSSDPPMPVVPDVRTFRGSRGFPGGWGVPGTRVHWF